MCWIQIYQTAEPPTTCELQAADDVTASPLGRKGGQQGQGTLAGQDGAQASWTRFQLWLVRKRSSHSLRTEFSEYVPAFSIATQQVADRQELSQSFK